MSNLYTFCVPCAKKLGLTSTLLPALSRRPCDGCQTPVGFDWQNGNEYIEYYHVWEREVFPIALGVAIQDNYGTHVHQYRTRSWSAQTGRVAESCRCGSERIYYEEVKPQPKIGFTTTEKIGRAFINPKAVERLAKGSD